MSPGPPVPGTGSGLSGRTGFPSLQAPAGPVPGWPRPGSDGRGPHTSGRRNVSEGGEGPRSVQAPMTTPARNPEAGGGQCRTRLLGWAGHRRREALGGEWDTEQGGEAQGQMGCSLRGNEGLDVESLRVRVGFGSRVLLVQRPWLRVVLGHPIHTACPPLAWDRVSDGNGVWSLINGI